MGFEDFKIQFERSISPVTISHDQVAIGLLAGLPPTLIYKTSREIDLGGADYLIPEAQQSTGAILVATAPLTGVDVKRRYNSPTGRPMSYWWQNGPEVLIELLAMGRAGIFFRGVMPPGWQVHILEGESVVYATSNSQMYAAFQQHSLANYKLIEKDSRGLSGDMYKGMARAVPLAHLQQWGVDVLSVHIGK